MPRLFVEGPYAYTDLRVLDAQLREVASGIRALVVEVPAGIYRVEARVPGAVDERLVSVPDEGDTRFTDFTLPFNSAAPIRETRSYREYHESAARFASRDVNVRVHRGQAVGRLFICVRSDGSSRPAPPVLNVLTAEGEVLARLDRQGKIELGEGFSVLSIELAAGTYMLAHEDAAFGYRGQAVFVERGWQTQVFAPWDEDGVGLPRALISMVRIGQGFDPSRIEYGYVEAALDGLARGRVVLAPSVEDALLNAKFEDPMLGLIGAYAYLRRGAVDLERISLIATNLQRLLPNSPDVRLLVQIAGLLNRRPEFFGRSVIGDPPMLALATDWLIDLAAYLAWLVPAASWLAQVAVTRTTGSVWTRCDLNVDPGRRLQAVISEVVEGLDDARMQLVDAARAAGVPLSVLLRSMF